GAGAAVVERHLLVSEDRSQPLPWSCPGAARTSRQMDVRRADRAEGGVGQVELLADRGRMRIVDAGLSAARYRAQRRPEVLEAVPRIAGDELLDPPVEHVEVALEEHVQEPVLGDHAGSRHAAATQRWQLRARRERPRADQLAALRVKHLETPRPGDARAEQV